MSFVSAQGRLLLRDVANCPGLVQCIVRYGYQDKVSQGDPFLTALLKEVCCRPPANCPLCMLQGFCNLPLMYAAGHLQTAPHVCCRAFANCPSCMLQGFCKLPLIYAAGLLQTAPHVLHSALLLSFEHDLLSRMLQSPVGCHTIYISIAPVLLARFLEQDATVSCQVSPCTPQLLLSFEQDLLSRMP